MAKFIRYNKIKILQLSRNYKGLLFLGAFTAVPMTLAVVHMKQLAWPPMPDRQMSITFASVFF